jgi:prevent-host-death family protein
MVTLEVLMTKQYSIAQARDHFPGIVKEVEHGAPVELTRRGKPVAILLSVEQYQRLKSGRMSLGEAIDRWRAETDFEALGITGDEFEGLRDPSLGREFEW